MRCEVTTLRATEEVRCQLEAGHKDKHQGWFEPFSGFTQWESPRTSECR